MPAFLFLLDQAAHAAVMLVAWFALLSTAPVTNAFGNAIHTALGSADPVTAHHVVLVGVVLLDLAIVNIRAGSLFVATLVHPREVVTGEGQRVRPTMAIVAVPENVVLLGSEGPTKEQYVFCRRLWFGCVLACRRQGR